MARKRRRDRNRRPAPQQTSMVPRGAEPKATPVNHQLPIRAQSLAAMYNGRPPGQITAINARVREAMAAHVIPAAFIDKLCQMLLPYLRLPSYDGDTGFEVVWRDMDTDVALEIDADQADEEKAYIVQLLTAGGQEVVRDVDGQVGVFSGSQLEKALPLRVAGPLLVKDYLVHGMAYIRIEPGKNPAKYPVAWWRPLPAAQMRLADPQFYQRQYRKDVRWIEYVLLNKDEQVELEMTCRECAHWARDPHIYGDEAGYGRSVMDRCVDVIMALACSWKWNVELFTANKLPPGVLQVPDVNETIMDEFLSAMSSNMGNASGQWHSIPIIRADDDKPSVMWIPLGEVPTDMQFQTLFNMAVSIVGGNIGLSPESIGLQSYTQQKQTLQEADPQSRIQEGRNNGFVPLVQGLFEFLDEALVKPLFGGRWRIVPRQLTDSSEERNNKLRRDRISMGFSSVDEERILSDKPVRQLPVDLDLWWEVEKALLQEHPELVEDSEKKFNQTRLLYAAKGGNFSISTQVPLPPQAGSIIMQELQLKQSAGQEGMEGMGMPGMEGAPRSGAPGMFGPGADEEGSEEPDEWVLDENEAQAQDGAQQPRTGSQGAQFGKSMGRQRPGVGPRVLRFVLQPVNWVRRLGRR